MCRWRFFLHFFQSSWLFCSRTFVLTDHNDKMLLSFVFCVVCVFVLLLLYYYITVHWDIERRSDAWVAHSWTWTRHFAVVAVELGSTALNDRIGQLHTWLHNYKEWCAAAHDFTCFSFLLVALSFLLFASLRRSFFVIVKSSKLSPVANSRCRISQ